MLIHSPRLIHLSAGPGGWALRADSGPPSLTVSVGHKAHLQCLYNSSIPRGADAKWFRVIQGNYTWPAQFLGYGEGSTGNLTFSEAVKNHTGLYLCEITDNATARVMWRSCGTYLRVRGECGPWLPGPPTPQLGPRGLLVCEVGTEPVPAWPAPSLPAGVH